MDDNSINRRLSRYNESIYGRSAPSSVALEPIVVFGSDRVSTASSYKSAKSMTDSVRQSKKFPKLSTIASVSQSQSTNPFPSQRQNVSNLQPTPPQVPPPISALLTPDKRSKLSSISPSKSHRSYTPSSQYSSQYSSSQYSSLSKPPLPPPSQQLQSPPQQQPSQPLTQIQQSQPITQRQQPSFQQQPPFQPQYPYDPYQQQYPPQQQQYQPQQQHHHHQQQQQQQLYPPYYPPQPQYPLQNQNYQQNYYQQPPLQQPPQQQQPPPYLYQPSLQPIYYPPPTQNNSTICVPQSEVPEKIIYREVQEEKPLSPRQYFIYRNGCALRIMKWYRKQKQIKKERKLMKIADDVSVSSSERQSKYEIGSHVYNEMVIRQADQFLLDQQTRKNRSLLGELTKEIYENDLNEFLRDIIIEAIHEDVSEYFSRHEVVYNKRISDPPVFDTDPERIEVRSLIREGILDRLISHGLLNKLSRDTNSEDNFYDLP